MRCAKYFIDWFNLLFCSQYLRPILTTATKKIYKCRDISQINSIKVFWRVGLYVHSIISYSIMGPSCRRNKTGSTQIRLSPSYAIINKRLPSTWNANIALFGSEHEIIRYVYYSFSVRMFATITREL